MNQFFSKALVASWDAAILNAVANTRKKFPLKTSQRELLLKIARDTLLEKKNQQSCIYSLMESSEKEICPDFVFVTLFTNRKEPVCLGGGIQKGSLILTVRNIVKEITSIISQEHLTIPFYFEIELLFDEQHNLENFNSGLYAMHLIGTDAYFKSSVSIKNQWDLEMLTHNLHQKARVKTDLKAISLLKAMTFREGFGSKNHLYPPLQDLYRFNELVLPSEVTRTKLVDSLKKARKYLQRSLLNSKKMIYYYDPVTKEELSPSNTSEWIRIFAALWSFLENTENLTESIILQVKILILRSKGNNVFFEHEGIADLGTNALITLCEQCLQQHFTKKYQSSRSEFLFGFIKEDGSFYTFLTEGRYYKGEEHQYFLPFMGMIALLRENNPAYTNKIESKSLPVYLNFYKNSSVEQKLAMSMWLCRVLFEMYKYKKIRIYSDTIFEICDDLCALQNRFLNENVDLIGTFTNDYSTCTTAVILESLGIGMSIAVDNDLYRYEKYKECILLGLRFLLQMQYTPTNCLESNLHGGFRFSPFNQGIRVDVVQHAIFAINHLLCFTKNDS